MDACLTSTTANPLEERYAQKVLLVLLENGEQKKTTLMRMVSKSSSMQARMDALELNGLIRTRSDSFNYNTKWVDLTDKGKDVAVLLKKISKIMEE